MHDGSHHYYHRLCHQKMKCKWSQPRKLRREENKQNKTNVITEFVQRITVLKQIRITRQRPKTDLLFETSVRPLP